MNETTDYIERKDALNFDTSITCDPCEIQAVTKGAKLVMDHIKSIPSADVKSVVRGVWEKTEEFPGFRRCSACRDCYLMEEYIAANKWGFCPHCGAEMSIED